MAESAARDQQAMEALDKIDEVVGYVKDNGVEYYYGRREGGMIRRVCGQLHVASGRLRAFDAYSGNPGYSRRSTSTLKTSLVRMATVFCQGRWLIDA